MSALLNVPIDQDGKFVMYEAYQGDRVAFIATVDTVVCVEDPTIFGGQLFQIPAGQRLVLNVQSFANRTPGGFKCIAVTGDLDIDLEQVLSAPTRQEVGGVIIPPA